MYRSKFSCSQWSGSVFALATCIAFLAQSLAAAPRTYDLELVLNTLDGPRDIANAGDDRLFVALKNGRIVIVENGAITGTFLDIRGRVVTSSSEQGELGLASVVFHPDYASNGFFYVVYTDAAEDSLVSRFSRQAGNPNRADPSSERLLLRIPQPWFNHNANHVRFSVQVVSEGGTATAGEDYLAIDQVVSWADGEDGIKSANLTLLDDVIIEASETVDLRIVGAAGGAGIGQPAITTLTIQDDDLPTTCIEDEETLCLNDGRFAVRISWRTRQTREGFGTAVTITEDGGWYWFFRPGNPEVFVKVLNACTNNGHFWIFAGGMTDVETRMTVVDTESGRVNIYDSVQGAPFGTIRDTRAFATCP